MKLYKSTLFVLLFLFSLGSCVKKENVDFTQADNLIFHQQINASLINLKATLSDFDEIITFNGLDYTMPLDVFNNTTVQNELENVTFHFEFINTFDRNFRFIFNFKDVSNVLVYTTTVDANKKGTTNQDVLVEGLDVAQIKKATSVDINVVVLNSIPLNTIDNTVGAFVNFNLSASLTLRSGQPIEASLISLTASLPDFTKLDNIPFTHFDFITRLDILNASEIKNRLEKAAFHFEIENTFNRDFEIIFEFLDKDGLVTYKLTINLNKTSNTTHDEIIEGGDLDNLTRSTKVRVQANVINATTMDNTLGASINFKSSGTFFF